MGVTAHHHFHNLFITSTLQTLSTYRGGTFTRGGNIGNWHHQGHLRLAYHPGDRKEWFAVEVKDEKTSKRVFHRPGGKELDPGEEGKSL